MKEAQAHQIPVLFVLLSHSPPDATAGQDKNEAWKAANRIESAICEALEQEPLHLIRQYATAEGIQKAFEEVRAKMFVQHSDNVIRVVRS